MCAKYYSLGDVFKLALNSSESFNLISGKKKQFQSFSVEIIIIIIIIIIK